MAEELAKKILADLEKSGFPLEVWTAMELTKLGWAVTHQEYYVDLLGKPRTIDLDAAKLVVDKRKVPERITVKLIIECKRFGRKAAKKDEEPIEKQWVFYVDPNPPFTDTSLASLSLLNYAHIGVSAKQLVPILTSSHVFRDNPRYSHIALDAFSEGWNTTTYEGISQASQATTFLKKRIGEIMKETIPSEQIQNGLVIFYPIVILEGQMFDWSIDGQGKSVVVESNHVIHSIEYDSNRFFVDVVTKDYFPILVKEINKEVDQLGQVALFR